MNAYGFVFTMTLVAIIPSREIGWEPSAQLSLDAATWRRGTFSDGIILKQIGLGLVCMTVAAIVALRLSRQTTPRRLEALAKR